MVGAGQRVSVERDRSDRVAGERVVTFPAAKHDDTVDPLMDAVSIAFSKAKAFRPR